MSETKPRYFVEKPQKKGTLFYWQPGKALIAAGFKIVALSRDRAAAIQEAEALNSKVDQFRGGLPVLAKNRHGTVPWIIEQYENSHKYKKLRAATHEARKYQFGQLLRWSAERGDPPMRTIKRRDALALWERFGDKEKGEGKPRKAKALIDAGCLLWNFALRDLEDENAVDKNPFANLGLDDLPPRQVVWTPGQIAAAIEAALITSAIRVGRGGYRLVLGYRKSMALAIMIAANTAQRPSDIRAMNESQYNGKTITLTQIKTGTTLEIPVTAELKQALDDELAARRADGKVVSLHQQDRPLVINEVTGRRYTDCVFINVFGKVRDAAGLPSHLQFRDLRRTATVQLAEAGCQVPEIAAYGGWSLNTVHEMLKVYCPLNLTMAQNALVKLEAYRASGKLEA